MLIRAVRSMLGAFRPSGVDIKKMHKLYCSFEQMNASLSSKQVLCEIWAQRVVSGRRNVQVHIYTPIKQKSRKILLFFHANRWTGERAEAYRFMCANLAVYNFCRVFSVEYSPTPENSFPKGLDDCYAAARELYAHAGRLGVNPADIVLIGDSFGGNLAAAVSLRAQDEGLFAVQKQILLYPVTNSDHTENAPFPSVLENGTDYLLTSAQICEDMERYKRSDQDLHNPYFAPLLAKNLKKQPNTLIITAEYDPLRDEGEAYGQRLEKAGVKVTVFRMPDVLHGFFSLEPLYTHVKVAYALIHEFLYEEGVPAHRRLWA